MNQKNQDENIATFSFGIRQNEDGTLHANVWAERGGNIRESEVNASLVEIGSAIGAIVTDELLDVLDTELRRLRADYDEAETQRQELEAELGAIRAGRPIPGGDDDEPVTVMKTEGEPGYAIPPRETEPDEQAEPTTWNPPVGTDVIVTDGDGEPFHSKTAGSAFWRQGKQFVMVEGDNRAFPIEDVQLVSAQTPRHARSA